MTNIVRAHILYNLKTQNYGKNQETLERLAKGLRTI